MKSKQKANINVGYYFNYIFSKYYVLNKIKLQIKNS